MAEEFFQPAKRCLSLGDTHHASGQKADHSIQETVSLKTEGYKRAGTEHLDASEGAGGVFFPAMPFGRKGGEVVGSLQ